MSDSSDQLNDPLAEVMKKLDLEASTTAEKTETVKVDKTKLFNKKYYRSVNIDVTAEEKKQKETEEKAKRAEKKKKEDEEEKRNKEEVNKILKGMGFEVK
jgi:hypothetical protein